VPNGDHRIQAPVNEQDKRRVETFRSDRNLNHSEAVRRLVDRGLEYEESWAMVRDVSVAAVLWAVTAVVGAVGFNLVPNSLAMFSVAFAGVLVTAYGGYELRWRLRDWRE